MRTGKQLFVCEGNNSRDKNLEYSTLILNSTLFYIFYIIFYSLHNIIFKIFYIKNSMLGQNFPIFKIGKKDRTNHNNNDHNYNDNNDLMNKKYGRIEV